MTVKELMEFLESVPEELSVYIGCEWDAINPGDVPKIARVITPEREHVVLYVE